MSKSFWAGAVCVALLSLAGWALAQQGQPGPKKTEGERYMVAPAGDGAILLETTTGKTWVMRMNTDPSYWLPAMRFDREEDFQAWREAERKKVEEKRVSPRK
ncbi:MAG: hypothetical protein HY040_05220 [Planctomycetes bacterium]|nr:hypothetical protein [Planctomycetota bacterium]